MILLSELLVFYSGNYFLCQCSQGYCQTFSSTSLSVCSFMLRSVIHLVLIFVHHHNLNYVNLNHLQFKILLDFILYVWVFASWIYYRSCMPNACGGQKSVLDTLVPSWGLELNPAISALNHWTVSQVLPLMFISFCLFPLLFVNKEDHDNYVRLAPN